MMSVRALAVSPLTGVVPWARSAGLQIVLLILGAVLLVRLVRWVSPRITQRIDLGSTGADELVASEAAKHRHALAQVLSWCLRALVYSVATVLVGQRLGLPSTGFVAPAAVVGVALGLGAQGVVQDLLSGVLVVSERQYGFGDLIRISVLGVPAPVLGTVEDVSLRITTVRTASGEVVITPNGHIVQVTNLSREWARAVIDVPVPLSSDVERISEVLRAAGVAAVKDPQLGPLLLDVPAVMGVESIDVDQFKIRVVARTLPGKQFEVGRAFRARITETLVREGASPPSALETVGESVHP